MLRAAYYVAMGVVILLGALCGYLLWTLTQ